MSVTRPRTADLAPPGPELDPYLDAFSSVVQRHGLTRARVTDVADELGVSRVTVYRQAGSISEMTSLFVRREVYRNMPNTSEWASADDPISALVALLADLTTRARRHPVLAKVIADEPQLIGPYLVRHLPYILAASAVFSAKLFQSAIDRGAIAPRDPKHLGDWTARILISAVLAPPKGSLVDFFDAGLRPLLEPTT